MTYSDLINLALASACVLGIVLGYLAGFSSGVRAERERRLRDEV